MSARAGMPLVKKWEKCRLGAFLPTLTDPWTIGWGHTKDVKEGDICTQAQADAWLLQEYDEAEAAVLQAVTTALNDNQLGALTSFVYNVGPGIPGVKDGFCHLKDGGQSHLLRYCNLPSFTDAANQFPLWDRAGGVVLLGLVNRRNDERALFLS